MTLRVHFLNPPDDLEPLRSLLDEGILISAGAELPAEGAEIIVGGRPDEAMAAQAKAIIVPWAGIPEKTLELVRRYPELALHNLHHNAPQVAELAIALLFSAAKFILPGDADLRKGDWSGRYQPARAVLLAGKTAVVLGYGSIGRYTGSVLKAMGMRVIGVNRSGPSSQDAPGDRVFTIDSMAKLLPEADVLLLALPLTDATRSLIGPAEIDRLPVGAIVVNVGRGPLIDQHALYEGLKSGKIGAAGLDVWWNYPDNEEARTHTFPADAPLHELDNVVMSPHRGGAVKERDEGWLAALAELLNAFRRGETVPNWVDVDNGY